MSVLYIAWASLLVQTMRKESSIENGVHSNFPHVFQHALIYKSSKLCDLKGLSSVDQDAISGNETVLLNLILYGPCIILQYICNPTGYTIFDD